MDASECWWFCQVIGSFFELYDILHIGMGYKIIFRACASFLRTLCQWRHDGAESKALRKLCNISILECSRFEPQIFLQTIELLLEMCASSNTNIAWEMAYCMEICALHLVNNSAAYPDTWDAQSLLEAGLSLCAIKLPEETQRQLVPEGETSEEGWRGLDGRRCEHALHAVANAAELLAKRSSPISSLGTFTQVMEVFSTSLRVTSISGAEKIRWNTALASTRLMKIGELTSALHPGTKGESCDDYIIAPLVSALCFTFEKDAYYKVRAHAGLSLMLLWKNTLDGSLHEHVIFSAAPAVIFFSAMIIKASVAFLSTDAKAFNENGSSEAQQHITICFFTAILLFLHHAVYSLLALGTSMEAIGRSNLLLVEQILVTGSPVVQHFSNALHFAKEAQIAALSVTRGAQTHKRCPLRGLARLVDQPTKISFVERYAIMDKFNFDKSVPALLQVIKFYDKLLTSGLSGERSFDALAGLSHLILDGYSDVVSRDDLLEQSTFKTSYD